MYHGLVAGLYFISGSSFIFASDSKLHSWGQNRTHVEIGKVMPVLQSVHHCAMGAGGSMVRRHSSDVSVGVAVKTNNGFAEGNPGLPDVVSFLICFLS